MHRIRLRLPKGQAAPYRYQDLLHDALINAWLAAGAAIEQVLGAQARPWTFAAIGGRRKDYGIVHTLVVATPDTELARYLRRFDPAQVRYARASTAELVDFSQAEIIPEPDPIPPQQGALGVLMLSPLAVSDLGNDSRRWHNHLSQVDLSPALSQRLSRLAGRPVQLQIQADPLYLRANPRHDVLVKLKQTPKGPAFVIGMKAPLVLAGGEEDLRLAWYAGLGEKTRNGFGCIGLLERGIRR
jgi:CRISPR-associated endoribonuclease Cas6